MSWKAGIWTLHALPVHAWGSKSMWWWFFYFSFLTRISIIDTDVFLLQTRATWPDHGVHSRGLRHSALTSLWTDNYFTCPVLRYNWLEWVVTMSIEKVLMCLHWARQVVISGASFSRRKIMVERAEWSHTAKDASQTILSYMVFFTISEAHNLCREFLAWWYGNEFALAGQNTRI